MSKDSVYERNAMCRFTDFVEIQYQEFRLIISYAPNVAVRELSLPLSLCVCRCHPFNLPN